VRAREVFTRRRDFAKFVIGRAAHAERNIGVAYRDPEAGRAYARRYYAQNRDAILAQQRAMRAARTPERLELLRARRGERRRTTIDALRAAAREAARRWRLRNAERYAPRRRHLDRERYAINRDALRSARRKRYATNPDYADRTRALNRAWYERNREARREYRRRYRQEHGDELRARHRERNRHEYARDPRARLDYYKQWRLRNLERARTYVRVSGNKRRAAAAGKHFTLKEWGELLRTFDDRCAYCGSTKRIEADHRVPLCRGGSNEISNILPACIHCNRRKHCRTEEEFRALLAAECAERAGG
jgi:5-methylcytosine-specific restriction endonuclease McrA